MSSNCKEELIRLLVRDIWALPESVADEIRELEREVILKGKDND